MSLGDNPQTPEAFSSLFREVGVQIQTFQVVPRYLVNIWKTSDSNRCEQWKKK